MIRFRRLTSFEQLRRFSSFPRSQPSRCHLLGYHSNAIKQENALSTWNTNTEYWHYVHNAACDSFVLFKSRKWICNLSLLQIKPSQSVNWGAETCAKRKSTSLCLLAILAFDRIAGLSNRHLNSNRGIC